MNRILSQILGLVDLFAVAGAISLAGSSFARASSPAPADLLVQNAHIVTMNPAKPEAEAVVVKDGKVLAIGSSAELRSGYVAKETLDLKGGYVLPGLIDAHGHLASLGRSLSRVDLHGASSKAEILERLKKFEAGLPPGAWLQGRGWDQNLWPEKAFPTHQDLDAVFKDRPVWLDRVDGHAAWANAKAMALAGVSRASKEPQGGKILRDSKGDPTGVFIDQAEDLVDNHIPEAPEAWKLSTLRTAVAEVRKNGITSVHDAGVDPDGYARLKKLEAEGTLGLRVYVMHSGAGATFDSVCAAGPKSASGNGLVTRRAVKLFADGALGSRGAALLADYSDEPGNRGLMQMTPSELRAAVLKVYRCGFQVAVHAIGDRGNREVLDAFEAAIQATGRKDLRPRVEHAQVVSLPDIERFKKLSAIASMQPVHATSDMPWAEKRVGPERIKGAYAWRRYLNLGVVLAGGSDFPVELVNPFHGIYAAITRQDAQGQPAGGWYPDQALTRMEALKAFTWSAAYAGFQEKEIGSLETGKWADFIVVDRDVLKASPLELRETKVLKTYLAGKKVYSKE